jgi:hypothetical protein
VSSEYDDSIEYIACIILRAIKKNNKKVFSGSIGKLSDLVQHSVNLTIHDDLLFKSVKILSRIDGCSIETDRYAGTFVFLTTSSVSDSYSKIPNQKIKFEMYELQLMDWRRENPGLISAALVLGVLGSGRSMPSMPSLPDMKFFENYKIIKKYAEFGDAWIDEVAKNISFESHSELANQEGAQLNAQEQSLESDRMETVPASDRIVSRKDNQLLVDQIESALNGIEQELKSNNEVGQTLADQRLIFSSEIAGARKIISFEQFSLDSVKRLIVPMLSFLAKSFANGTIGALAKQLLEALLK